MHTSVSLGTQEETGKSTSSVDGFSELSSRWNSGWKKSFSAALRAFLLLFSCPLRLDEQQTQLSQICTYEYIGKHTQDNSTETQDNYHSTGQLYM